MTLKEFNQANVQSKTKQELIDMLYKAVCDCYYEKIKGRFILLGIYEDITKSAKILNSPFNWTRRIYDI